MGVFYKPRAERVHQYRQGKAFGCAYHVSTLHMAVVHRPTMDNLNRVLLAKPEGLLYLFFSAGVSIDILACAFETTSEVIESSIREAMRKREALVRADLPVSMEIVRRR
jgi:hypothetical protein